MFATEPQNPGDVLKGVQKFWLEFREVVLAGDTNRIDRLTVFPFKTRGALDTSPVRNYDRESFHKILGQLLD